MHFVLNAEFANMGLSAASERKSRGKLSHSLDKDTVFTNYE